MGVAHVQEELRCFVIQLVMKTDLVLEKHNRS